MDDELDAFRAWQRDADEGIRGLEQVVRLQAASRGSQSMYHRILFWFLLHVIHSIYFTALIERQADAEKADLPEELLPHLIPELFRQGGG